MRWFYFLFLLCFQASFAADAATPIKTVPKDDKPVLSWAFSSTGNLPEKFRMRLMSEKHPLFKMIEKNLPEYRQEHFFGTVNRIENELKTKSRVCFPASTAYESRMSFTYLTPITIVPSPLVIMTKEKAKLYKDKNGTISLHQLMQNKKLSGLLIDARSYGSKIDKILAQGNIKRSVLTPIGDNTVRMVENNRADYTLEFAFIIEGLIDNNHFGKNLEAIPLNDLRDGITMYAACSRTPEGLEVIKKIDQIVREVADTEEYHQALMIFAPQGEQHKFFEKQVDAFITKRKKNVPDVH